MMDWLEGNFVQVMVTLGIVATYGVLDRISATRLEALFEKGRFKEDAAQSAIRIARLLTGVAGLLVLTVVWGIELRSFIVVAGTALTLLGVALFAAWSLLSNVTAYFILLFHPSFRRGQFVRILDADNYAEGYIADISPFSVRLITESRETILYPNNMILGRPTLINPRDRLGGVGKLPPQPAGANPQIEEG